MHKIKPRLAVCLALLLGLVICPLVWGADSVEQELMIDLEFVRQQALVGNRDYLQAEQDLELARIQLTSAVADNLQRASVVNVKQAESNFKAAERNLEIAAKNAQLDGEIKYYNFVKAERQVAIAKDALEQAKEQMRIIKVKHEEGMATNLDLRQAEQMYLQSSNSYQSAVKNLALARAQLNSVLGLDLAQPFQVADQDFSYTPLDLSLDQALKLALANNSMLIELQEQLEIAKLDEKAADNDFTAPLVAQTKTLQREKLELRIASLNDQIYLQTVELWNSVQALNSNYLASLVAVEIAEENYRIIQVRFEDGLEIPVNLLSAQIELDRATQQALNSLFDYNVAKSQLLINIGINSRSDNKVKL